MLYFICILLVVAMIIALPTKINSREEIDFRYSNLQKYLEDDSI